MSSNESVGHYVEEFARSVVQQNEAIEAHDPLSGNVHAGRYLEAFRELRRAGDPGLDALSSLLEDERRDVRTMAACFLLAHKTEKALEVLRASAQQRGVVGLGAVMTLKRWEEGTWDLDTI